MLDRFLTYLRLELNRSPLTVEAYRRDLGQLAGFLSPAAPEAFDAASVTAADLRAWLAAMSRAGDSPRTLRRKTQSARSLFRWMRKTGLRPDNPAADITLAKTSKPLPVFVREDEMEQLLAAPLPGSDPVVRMRDHLTLELLYTCGLRQAELLSLTDADIDTRAFRITVTGKGSKTRVIPIAEETARAIEMWQKIRDDSPDPLPSPAPLLPGRGGRPLSKAALYKRVHALLSLTSARARGPHTLRHTFATSMVNGGADLMTVKELLGHASLSTTQIYTHLDFKRLRSDYADAHPRERQEKTGAEGKEEKT